MRANCSSLAFFCLFLSSLVIVMFFWCSATCAQQERKSRTENIFKIRRAYFLCLEYFVFLSSAPREMFQSTYTPSKLKSWRRASRSSSNRQRHINQIRIHQLTRQLSAVVYTRYGYIWIVRRRWHGEVWWTQTLNTKTRQAQQCRIHGSLFIIIWRFDCEERRAHDTGGKRKESTDKTLLIFAAIQNSNDW